jgi:hypothetical protein
MFSKVTYTLPLNSVSKFQQLFQELEQTHQLIGIDYFAISMTTLDEVFLKLGTKFLEFIFENSAVYYILELKIR